MDCAKIGHIIGAGPAAVLKALRCVLDNGQARTPLHDELMAPLVSTAARLQVQLLPPSTVVSAVVEEALSDLAATALSECGKVSIASLAESVRMPVSWTASRMHGLAVPLSGCLCEVGGQQHVVAAQAAAEQVNCLLSLLRAAEAEVSVADLTSKLWMPHHEVMELLLALCREQPVPVQRQAWHTAVAQHTDEASLQGTWQADHAVFVPAHVLESRRQAALDSLSADGYLSDTQAEDVGLLQFLAGSPEGATPAGQGPPPTLKLPSGFLLQQCLAQAAMLVIAELGDEEGTCSWCDASSALPSRLSSDDLEVAVSALAAEVGSASLANAQFEGLECAETAPVWMGGALFASPGWVTGALQSVQQASKFLAANQLAMSRANTLLTEVQEALAMALVSQVDLDRGVEAADQACGEAKRAAADAHDPALDSFVLVGHAEDEPAKEQDMPLASADNEATIQRAEAALATAQQSAAEGATLIKELEAAQQFLNDPALSGDDSELPPSLQTVVQAAKEPTHGPGGIAEQLLAALLQVDDASATLDAGHPVAVVAALRQVSARSLVARLAERASERRAEPFMNMSWQPRAAGMNSALFAGRGGEPGELSVASAVVAACAEHFENAVRSGRALVYAAECAPRSTGGARPARDFSDLEAAALASALALLDAAPVYARGLFALTQGGEAPRISRTHWSSQSPVAAKLAQWLDAQGLFPTEQDGESASSSADAVAGAHDAVLSHASKATAAAWMRASLAAAGDALLVHALASTVPATAEHLHAVLEGLCVHPLLVGCTADAPSMGHELLHAYLPPCATTPAESSGAQRLLTADERRAVLAWFMDSFRAGPTAHIEPEDQHVAGASAAGEEAEPSDLSASSLGIARAPFQGAFPLLLLQGALRALEAATSDAQSTSMLIGSACALLEVAVASAMPAPTVAAGAATSLPGSATKKAAALPASACLESLRSLGRDVGANSIPRRVRGMCLAVLRSGQEAPEAARREVLLAAANLQTSWDKQVRDTLDSPCVLLRCLPSKHKPLKRLLKAEHAQAVKRIADNKSGASGSHGLAARVAAVFLGKSARGCLGTLPLLNSLLDGEAGKACGALLLLSSTMVQQQEWEAEFGTIMQEE